MSSFYGLELETAPGRVFTPRHSTEALVEAAVAKVRNRPQARVADVGTGSGAIAIALARELPNAEIWASDVSPAAVELTRLNAVRHGLSHRIHMAVGDLLDPIPAPLCIVVANLPYLPDWLRDDAAYADLRSEPEAAVFAAAGGLEHYLRLLTAAEERLDPEGALVIQFHREVLEAVRDDIPELRRRLHEHPGLLDHPAL
jgi:release factor glutamine methyltransferase